jgi:hypothetical protein
MTGSTKAGGVVTGGVVTTGGIRGLSIGDVVVCGVTLAEPINCPSGPIISVGLIPGPKPKSINLGSIGALVGILDMSKAGPPILTGGTNGFMGASLGIEGMNSSLGSPILSIDIKSSLLLGINGVCNIGAVGDAKIDSSNTGGNTGAGMGLGNGPGPIGSSIGCGATGKGIIGKLPKGLVDIGSILCAIGSLDRFSNKRLFLTKLFKNPITNLPSLDSLQTSSSSCRCF